MKPFKNKFRISETKQYYMYRKQPLSMHMISDMYRNEVFPLWKVFNYAQIAPFEANTMNNVKTYIKGILRE